MKRRSTNFGYFVREGVGSIFTHGFMSFATITVIIACLIIMGSFALLTLNINKMLETVGSENQILAFVDENLAEEQARALQSKVEETYNVSSAVFVTRAEAMEAFTSQYSDTGLFENMDSSILRDRFMVYLDDVGEMAATREALRQIPGIVNVNAHLEIARGFITVRNIVNWVSIALVVLLFIISLFIMANTIKLATIDRREDIAIMKMVGATNGFIRWPFVIEGLMLGICGSLLAFLLQWGIYRFASEKIAELSTFSFLNVIPFVTLALPMVGVFLAVGLLVGIGGSLMTIKNYLKV